MTTRATQLTLRPSDGTDLSASAGSDFRRDFIGQGSGRKIAGLGQALMRRWWLILITVVVLNVAASFGIHNLTPRYTSSAELIVSAREEQVVDLKAVLSGLSGSSDVIESEIQVLRSREVARSVVQKLNLDQLPEFNPALRPPGLSHTLSELTSGFTEWAVGLLHDFTGAHLPLISGLEGSGSATTAALDPTDPLSVPVDRFLSMLEVASKGRSRVITVSFTSTDASLSAKVPNAIGEAYIANQLQAKTRATAQATKWLDERVAEMREQLLAADDAVESYRRRAGIVALRDTTLLTQQLSELSQELLRAREQVAIMESRLAAVAKINPNAFGLNRDLDAAKARATSLEASLSQLRQQADVGSQSEIGLRALQREADADRNLYDKLLQRARETSVQSGLQQADASIISRAERPVEPSFPKPAIMQLLFFVASCIIAFPAGAVAGEPRPRLLERRAARNGDRYRRDRRDAHAQAPLGPAESWHPRPRPPTLKLLGVDPQSVYDADAIRRGSAPEGDPVRVVLGERGPVLDGLGARPPAGELRQAGDPDRLRPARVEPSQQERCGARPRRGP